MADYVSLLGRGDGYDQRLWRPALYRAFPGYRGPRQNLHRKVDYLRIFRNKIAHHGPIHHRHLTAGHDHDQKARWHCWPGGYSCRFDGPVTL
jgi:hypothetical protein